MANKSLKRSPISYSSTATPLPSCMPELNPAEPMKETHVVMAYNGQGNYIGHSLDVEAIRKYIYSKMVYKTKKAGDPQKAERAQQNRNRPYSYWVVRPENNTFNGISLVLVEMVFHAIDYLRDNDNAGKAEIVLDQFGTGGSFIGNHDQFALWQDDQKAFVSELEQITQSMKTRYNAAIRSRLQDMVDGAKILNAAPIALDI